MGKFDGYLICTDCDGTLTDFNRKISKENAEAIRYFQSEGGLFTVSSGRYPRYIKEFAADFVPNTYVIGCNGATLFDLEKDETVYVKPMSTALDDMLIYVFENIPSIKSVILSGEAEEYFHYIRKTDGVPSWLEGTDSLDNHIKFVSSAEEISDLIRACPGDIVRLLFVNETPEDNIANKKDLVEKFGHRYRFVMSWDFGLEVLEREWGKGEMIEYMKTLIPSIHTTVGVGDYDNDVSMLKLCDIGYAVDNAPDFIKEVADRVTVSCNDSAIARVISELE